MDGIFLVRMGQGGDDERARREAEWRRIRDRYLHRLVDVADFDTATAQRVMTVLF